MKKILFNNRQIVLIITIIIISFIIYLLKENTTNQLSFVEIVSRYQNIFFSSFFTIGSFLFSIMNMILFTMKEKIFDTEGYKKLHAKKDKKNISLYDPLQNFSKLFLLIIQTCFFITFICLMLISDLFSSFVEVVLSHLIFSASLVTILLILFTIYTLGRYLDTYFKNLEEQNKNDNKQHPS